MKFHVGVRTMWYETKDTRLCDSNRSLWTACSWVYKWIICLHYTSAVLFWYYNKIKERGILSTKLFQTLTINLIYFRSHIISTSFLRIVFSKIPSVIINTVRFTAPYTSCALLPEFQREEPATIAKVMYSRLLPPCW